MYGIAAPAPICLDDDLHGVGRRWWTRRARWCARPTRRAQRLVPDPSSGVGFMAPRRPRGGADGDAEIRLTYRELAALIEEAVERLR